MITSGRRGARSNRQGGRGACHRGSLVNTRICPLVITPSVEREQIGRARGILVTVSVSVRVRDRDRDRVRLRLRDRVRDRVRVRATVSLEH